LVYGSITEELEENKNNLNSPPAVSRINIMLSAIASSLRSPDCVQKKDISENNWFTVDG